MSEVYCIYIANLPWCRVRNIEANGNDWLDGLWYLTPFSTIFQLYRDGQFY